MVKDQRVSIRYENGTSVEANNLHDALVHIAHVGTDYVTDVVVDEPRHVECDQCGGAGVVDGPEPDVLWSRDDILDRVAQVNEQAPVSAVPFEDRVEAARKVAKG